MTICGYLYIDNGQFNNANNIHFIIDIFFEVIFSTERLVQRLDNTKFISF